MTAGAGGRRLSGEQRLRTGPVRPLFTLAEVVEQTGAAVEAAGWSGARVGPAGQARSTANDGPLPGEIVFTGVEVDSRLVRPGDLFCALPGERVDGHEFVGRALAGGALAAMVSHRPGGMPSGEPLLLVPVVVDALGRLAQYHHARYPVPVIGVTGSVGKTTTKDLIASALGASLTVLANQGNLNTDIGLPLTIFELGPEHQVACLEMGMRGPGEITRLAGLARPDVGVVTNIGPVHIELLGSIEAIARAKEELLFALPSGGVAVLNADDDLVRPMAERHRSRLAHVITYALDRPADVTAAGIQPAAGGGTEFTVLAGSDELGRLSVPLGGRHIVSNALAAIAVGVHFGLSVAEMAEGLRRPRLSAMRQEVTDAGGVRVINDAYNAGPASMKASIGLLTDTREKQGGRAIAILGDMLELGDYTEEAHVELGRTVARAGLDFFLAVGPRQAAAVRGAVEAGFDPGRAVRFDGPGANRRAAEAALGLVARGDTVLVKGSRGMKLEEVVEILLEGLGGGGVRP